MPTRSILINYAGYPRSPRNFIPDNGLAALAGALINAGHETLILDYSTVDIIKRLFPQEHSREMKAIVSKIKTDLKEGIKPGNEDLNRFYLLDDKIEKSESEKVLGIAQEIFEYTKRIKADFVGFKLFLGDAFEGSVMIAKYLKKKNPNLKIFAGGPHVDAFMGRMLKITDAFDVLAYGEGEETIVSLAEYAQGKKQLDQINNILYRKNGKIETTPLKRIEDLNSLPLPVYDEAVYPAMKGDNKIKVLLVDESRGCANSCNYCSHPVKSGKKIRLRDPGKVVDVMSKMMDKYGVTAFRFAGSSPPASHKKNIAREIINRNLKINYTTFCHVRGFEAEDFKILKESGCFAIFFGIESGSPEILRRSMNKNISIDQIKNAIMLCKTSGISVVGSVIVPAPFETEETKNMTFDLLCELKLDSVDVCFPLPIPGTGWGDELEKYNFDVEDKEGFWDRSITYKLKTYYPQALWKPFHLYKLNGKDFKDIAFETTQFIKALDKKGLPTQATDEILFLAHKAGLYPSKFLEISNQYLSEGNYSEIGKIVSKINENILLS